MPTFTKCNRAGHRGANLIFEAIGDDGKPYQFEMTTDAFIGLFAMGWKAAKALPHAPRQGQADRLDAEASFAILDMQPGLVLMSGPLILSLPLDAEKMALLQDGFASFQRTLNPERKH